jgi:acetyltransferase
VLVGEFFKHVTEHDLRLRFFNVVKNSGHAFLARLIQLDYARAMAFAALDTNSNLLGVVRLHADANYENGEYAILLRSDLKGQGLGWKLMELIISYGRAEGLKTIFGEVLAENTTMLAMCQRLGFDVSDSEEQTDIKIVRLSLS